MIEALRAWRNGRHSGWQSGDDDRDGCSEPVLPVNHACSTSLGPLRAMLAFGSTATAGGGNETTASSAQVSEELMGVENIVAPGNVTAEQEADAEVQSLREAFKQLQARQRQAALR